MGKESGVNCVFKVDVGSSTFTSVAGQNDTQFSGAGNPIDVSDKTTGGWGATIQGTRSVTVTVSGFANWGDTALDKLREAWENQEEVTGRVLLNSSGNNYQGSFSVTQFDIGASHDGATEYNVTLQNAGALTYAAAEA